MSDELDLFGEVVKHYKRLAYAAAPGSGPDGEKCGTCGFCTHENRAPRRWYKCGLMSGSHSDATDIALRSPACRFWKPEEAEAKRSSV